MAARILIVDDDPDILSGLKQRLEWLGHHIVSAKDGSESLTLIQLTALSLVLLHLELPLFSGGDDSQFSERCGAVVRERIVTLVQLWGEVSRRGPESLLLRRRFPEPYRSSLMISE